MSRIFPFVVILLSVGLFFGYVRPAWNGEIAQTRSEITSYNSALDAASRFTAKEAALEQQRNQLPTDQIARLNTFLPDSVDNVQLIVDLNALATRSGVVLSNFATSNTPNETAAVGSLPSANTGALSPSAQPVDSLTLNLSATGTYNAFRTFLSGIEQSLRPLDVSNLVVTNSETGVYTYQVTLKFYWLH